MGNFPSILVAAGLDSSLSGINIQWLKTLSAQNWGIPKQQSLHNLNFTEKGNWGSSSWVVFPKTAGIDGAQIRAQGFWLPAWCSGNKTTLLLTIVTQRPLLEVLYEVCYTTLADSQACITLKTNDQLKLSHVVGGSDCLLQLHNQFLELTTTWS